jgi:putative cell wall-binding protein
MSLSVVLGTPSASALYLDEKRIPGKPFTAGGYNTLDPATPNIVHRVYLGEGQRFRVWMEGQAGTDFDLILYPPEANDFTTPSVARSLNFGTSNEALEYHVPGHGSGWHYLCVRRMSGNGWCRLVGDVSWWIAFAGIPAPQRLWGRDRYETAVAIAAAGFPGWRGVKHVVLASGEDRAAADPLSASGLAWAYGAPILLVRSGETPACVLRALQEIVAQNGHAYVHIVGGPVSISSDALLDIERNVTHTTMIRLAPYDDRYTLAATIARRMVQERPSDASPVVGRTNGAALVANGEDPEKFFDALALSPLSSANGYPILLVRKDSIPQQTRQVLDDLGLSLRLLAGGPATVSEAVYQELRADHASCIRLWGRDRYETAAEIMEASVDGTRWAMPPLALLGKLNVGVSAKLPDALTGGSFLGLRGGTLVLTRTSSLPWASGDYLGDIAWSVPQSYVLGGPLSVDAAAYSEIQTALIP